MNEEKEIANNNIITEQPVDQSINNISERLENINEK